MELSIPPLQFKVVVFLFYVYAEPIRMFKDFASVPVLVFIIEHLEF
jgi:hypothetical protein